MKSLLIATQPLTYGTRRLRTGDSFVADQGDGPVYVTLGLAKTAPPVDESDLDAWRENYRAVFGRSADGRWGIDRIRKEIEKR